MTERVADPICLCGHRLEDHADPAEREGCEVYSSSLTWGAPDERCWCNGFEARS